MVLTSEVETIGINVAQRSGKGAAIPLAAIEDCSTASLVIANASSSFIEVIRYVDLWCFSLKRMKSPFKIDRTVYNNRDL